MPMFDEDPQVILQKAGDPSETVDVVSGRLTVDATLTPGVANIVQVEDPITGDKAKVDAAGRLQTATSIPAVPTGALEVHRVAQSSISGTSDDEYTITNGDDLTITLFQSGAEGGSSGKASKCELYHDPNGDKTGMELLAVGYHSNNSNSIQLARIFTGDGTARIVMRRERLDGGSMEVFASWDGYEL